MGQKKTHYIWTWYSKLLLSNETNETSFNSQGELWVDEKKSLISRMLCKSRWNRKVEFPNWFMLPGSFFPNSLSCHIKNILPTKFLWIILLGALMLWFDLHRPEYGSCVTAIENMSIQSKSSQHFFVKPQFHSKEWFCWAVQMRIYSPSSPSSISNITSLAVFPVRRELSLTSWLLSHTSLVTFLSCLNVMGSGNIISVSTFFFLAKGFQILHPSYFYFFDPSKEWKYTNFHLNCEFFFSPCILD